MHHVAFVHQIILTFKPPLACVLGSLLALMGNEIFKRHHLGTDKAFFKIGVNLACRSGRSVANPDGPGTNFLRPGGEKVCRLSN